MRSVLTVKVWRVGNVDSTLFWGLFHWQLNTVENFLEYTEMKSKQLTNSFLNEQDLFNIFISPLNDAGRLLGSSYYWATLFNRWAESEHHELFPLILQK